VACYEACPVADPESGVVVCVRSARKIFTDHAHTGIFCKCSTGRNFLYTFLNLSCDSQDRLRKVY